VLLLLSDFPGVLNVGALEPLGAWIRGATVGPFDAQAFAVAAFQLAAAGGGRDFPLQGAVTTENEAWKPAYEAWLERGDWH
jgi:hypothetical protein